MTSLHILRQYLHILPVVSLFLFLLPPSFPLSFPAYEVSAVVSLDNKEIDQTKWSPPRSRAWEKEIKIDLHQSREIEICIRARDGDLTTLSGLLYLRLEDYFDTNSVTYCLPLEPQGILLAEITYEIPRTERRQPKLKRGRRIFRRKFV